MKKKLDEKDFLIVDSNITESSRIMFGDNYKGIIYTKNYVEKIVENITNTIIENNDRLEDETIKINFEKTKLFTLVKRIINNYFDNLYFTKSFTKYENLKTLIDSIRNELLKKTGNLFFFEGFKKEERNSYNSTFILKLVFSHKDETLDFIYLVEDFYKIYNETLDYYFNNIFFPKVPNEDLENCIAN